MHRHAALRIVERPSYRSEWLGYEHGAQDRSVALALRVYLQEAGTCVLRLARVCECVSVCVRSGGWPGASFSPKGKGRDTLVGP